MWDKQRSYTKKNAPQTRRMPIGHTDQFEADLSPFASKSIDSKGRREPLSADTTRRAYERDYHRILYSFAFRRLRHKTQVFYAPTNDHICTRLDHSLQVSSISETICRHLRLNTDLANAIALGHDLGHAPFGHTGEDVINEVYEGKGLGHFMHEAHSLRVTDMMKELHGETLNLTYEVRDGIVCHCGEDFTQTLAPDRVKDVTMVNYESARRDMPYTLEGCVVRYVDRVAYLAADLQDAIELGIIKRKWIPKNVLKLLGTDSGEIIGNLIEDIIAQSLDKDQISTSKTIFGCISELYEFSKQAIYKCEAIVKQTPWVRAVISSLFDELLQVYYAVLKDGIKMCQKRYKERVFREFFIFMDAMQYDPTEKPEQIVLDYLAGMTDNFTLDCFNELFPMRIH